MLDELPGDASVIACNFDQSVNLFFETRCISQIARTRVRGRGESLYSFVHFTKQVREKDANSFEGENIH